MDLRLYRFEILGTGAARKGVYVPVDWHGALHDALLDHNVSSSTVAADFAANCESPAYRDDPAESRS